MGPLLGRLVVVRRFDRSDAAPLAAYRSDPATASMQAWEAPFTLAQAEAFVAWAARAPLGVPGEWCQLAIERRNQAGLVGDVGVLALVDLPGGVELGVTLAPGSRGEGLATEALTLVLDHLAAAHGVGVAVASLDVRNEASAALFERLGFTRSGTELAPDGVLEHRYERELPAR